MSISKILYNGFGIKDVILKSFDILEKYCVFTCTLKKKLKKCSKCRSCSIRIKETKVRRFRMLPLGSMKCFLELTVHKFFCHDCKSSCWVKLPFAVGKLPMTKSFANYILALIKVTTVKGVATFLGLQWDTVKKIHKDFLNTTYQKISYKKLAYLSMDEFSIKKGHTYMTVFLDIRTGRIIHAVQGRSVDDIRPFLERLAKNASHLKAIAMDMSVSYISAIKKYLPHVSIVFDRFHVMKMLNEALDDIRKTERAKHEKEGQSIGKGDRFLFLKNFDTLEADEKGRLQTLFKINKTLARAHALKEQLREFWNKTSKREGALFLIKWIFSAMASQIPGIIKVANTLLNHYEGLLNYFEHRISNGKIEGVNNKIKVLKRNAYGYRDYEYFTLLLYDLHEKTTQLVG